MAIVVTVKIRPRYVLAGTVQEPSLYDRVTRCPVELRPHQYAYKLIDWIRTADYLSDRVASYPVPSALLALRSEHNEDRRQASRKHSPRATRGAGRKSRHVPRKR